MADYAAQEDEESIKKRRIKIGVGIACAALAALMFYYNYGPTQKFRTDMRMYSDDDGKTWYPDSNNNIPPYQHNGKTAYAAQIFSYAGGSKQFCGYLVRFPDNVKAQIERAAAEGAKKTPPVSAAQLAWGNETALAVEVKAPMKNGPWVASRAQEAQPILGVKAPDGSELDQVLP